jgi:hypothetical protein
MKLSEYHDFNPPPPVKQSENENENESENESESGHRKLLEQCGVHDETAITAGVGDNYGKYSEYIGLRWVLSPIGFSRKGNGIIYKKERRPLMSR